MTMSILGTLFTDFKKVGGEVKTWFEKAAVEAPVVVSGISTVEQAVKPVLEGLLPNSQKAFDVTDTVMNQVAQAVEDLGQASASNGLNVQLNEGVVTDIRAVIASAKAAIGATATSSPATTTKPAPTTTLAP